MSDPIRIVIADDHTLVRSGVRVLLEAEPDIEVVGEALDGSEVLTLIESARPDIVLMDIAMPNMDGLEATNRIKERWPEVAVLVLTMYPQDEYFFGMLKAGASGYVLKGAGAGELIDAIRIVYEGKVFLSPAMAQRLVQDYLDRATGKEESSPTLSPRETEVLKMIAEGYAIKEIARSMVVSPSTIYTHRTNIMTKLGLSTRRELIQYAQDRGLIRGY